MKNENKVSFTVRLNLNNPWHRSAWERLHSGPGSYTATIVDALTKAANPVDVLDVDELKKIIRQAITESMNGLLTAAQPIIPSEEIRGRDEISDEDFESASDFLSALGC